MNTVPCKVCANILNNEIVEVREMYLGTRESFSYQKCGNCGLMQLVQIPADLARYYPPDTYYSLKGCRNEKVHVEWFRKIKAEHLLYQKKNLAGSLLSLGYTVPEYYQWLKKSKAGFSDAILDVGCGSGGLLKSLNRMGFTHLSGIDPFNEKDLDYGDVKIYRKDIFEMEGKYDLIMLNHVFEHMDKPEKIFKKLYELLNNGRYLLIRTPVMNNYAWQTYKTNWMSLDAPRHFIIHTEKSIQLLCNMAGFRLDDVVYDSTEDGLIGSEQYKKDMPLVDPASYFSNRKESTFSKQQINDFKRTAIEKNKEGNGDQAAFYLYKP